MTSKATERWDMAIAAALYPMAWILTRVRWAATRLRLTQKMSASIFAITAGIVIFFDLPEEIWLRPSWVLYLLGSAWIVKQIWKDDGTPKPELDRMAQRAILSLMIVNFFFFAIVFVLSIVRDGQYPWLLLFLWLHVIAILLAALRPDSPRAGYNFNSNIINRTF